MPSALAVFACRPNSHPFQERHVYLDEPVKIGRSVARCRPAQNNATFDCKVLSRNHALVWFDHKTGKFYLQDTKSSNGTFINSQRLSRGSEESPPCEVLSGDIIQFGVDVTENTRKVTHGCIVSTIKLFLPDGMEFACFKPTSSENPEQMLEQKLATLQRLLATTQEASESSWQALIDEDRLLSRLEVMGSQLQAYSKSQTEEGIRKELLALQEDKHNYETTAKESLRRVLQEKIEVVRKLSEVERSLSNTEDECTHLKEMSERSQEELRELANKYNAAVNEIKELTDKIKAAEGRQEELTQRGATEKRELELRIEEMEEKEQVLQARIEALQADNDFTNERLAALQVRLEQLQEKSVKENNSLGESTVFSSALLLFIYNLLCVCVPVCPSGNQMDAKESDMSDTLSPSKDRSSDDTSDGNMDDQELNEPQNRVALLKAELHRAGLEPGDTEQVIHHLHRELLEAQELANTGKQKCLELQALLEEERKNNSQLSEESTKQIQYLQTQLGKLQADMEALREQRESTICSTREELYSAQEEILMLRHAMEAATAEREREIAALQADLGGVRSELEHWRSTAAKYEAEIGRLQEAFAQQQQQHSAAGQLQGAAPLKAIRSLLEMMPCSWMYFSVNCVCACLCVCVCVCVCVCSTREQSLVLSSSLESLEKREEVLQDKLGSLENQHLQDASRLKSQLDQAQARTHTLQREYEDTQCQLSDLRQRYERTEQEKLNIHQELEQCRSSLKLLQDKSSSPSILQPVQAIFMGLVLALLYWCFGQLW
uniref:Sarcolemmal membrane-associated protein n=1 Tax=Salarias fasciatus TaxID=181472 RepID=A0A672GQS6_SALFA